MMSDMMSVRDRDVTFTSESEAWQAIADTLEMIRDLPLVQQSVDFFSRPCGRFVKARGLCGVILAMHDDRVIGAYMRDVMLVRLDRLCDQKRRRWLFPKGRWKPRAKLARRLAEQTR